MNTQPMILLNEEALAAPLDGTWFQLHADCRTQRPLLVNITGTATVSLEGRNDPDETGVELGEYTASTAVLIPAFPQMRVVVSVATASPDVRVSVDGGGVEIG